MLWYGVHCSSKEKHNIKIFIWSGQNQFFFDLLHFLLFFMFGFTVFVFIFSIFKYKYPFYFLFSIQILFFFSKLSI